MSGLWCVNILFGTYNFLVCMGRYSTIVYNVCYRACPFLILYQWKVVYFNPDKSDTIKLSKLLICLLAFEINIYI